MLWKKFNKILNIILILVIAAYIIKFLYQRPRYDKGEKAKDFTALLANGENFKLSELKGKYVLLDFWGSWCGPCRKENSLLVSLYNETRNHTYINASGFEIVSVAIENNVRSLEKAIQSDGLTWKYQVVQLEKFSSPIASLYGIREIPTKYFINPEGLIIMVNPTISEINSYLLEREEK